MEHVSVQGAEIPALGLGTWKLTGRECRRAVETALDLGYRHVDTARAYGNEQQVGEALTASDVPRDEVFLATKIPGRDAAYDDAMRAARESLRRLAVDHVDLLYLHHPNPVVPLSETMAALSDLHADGVARHVGVSNFSVRRLREARRAADAPIVADQIQFYPYRTQPDLREFCRHHDTALVAYSPLAHGGVLGDDLLREVGDRYGKTPAQVALRWAVQHDNVTAIPKASSRRHLAENVEIFDFELTRYEMEEMARPSMLRTGLAWARGRLGI
jgi:diketogulonate reductase-like aldo/keto reductase